MKYREQSTESRVQRAEYKEQRIYRQKNREAQLRAPPEIVWECSFLPLEGG